MILQNINSDKFNNVNIDTSTYYDSFSVGKWHKYTGIDRVSLRIFYIGRYRLKIVWSYIVGDILHSEVIHEEMIAANDNSVKVLELATREAGVYYFTMEAENYDNECAFLGATYEVDDKSISAKDINIAINICTYNRDDALRNNIRLIRDNFIDCEGSEMQGHLDVYITDNSNSERLLDLESDNITIIRSTNLGGAGGFTRGAMGILDAIAMGKNYSHVIFMDDDVEINPECIIRTCRLLKLLKDEYREAFIAGAMLRVDNQAIMYENGALWNEGSCKFYHRGKNLSDFENVVMAEEEVEKDYAAWWYTCMPIAAVRKDNLPLPLFIHEDDVEYSLRNAKGILTMNGIAIAHTVSEHRHISTNDYYNLRNMFIVNSIYCPNYGSKAMKKKVRNTMLMATLRYRYRDLGLIYKAVEDYLKGPEWLRSVDAAAYHRSLQGIGYQLADVSALVTGSVDGTTNASWKYHGIREWLKTGITFEKIMQLLSVNGYLRMGKHELHSFYMDVHPVDVYRCSHIVLYDDQDMMGIELVRHRWQLLRCAWLYIKASVMISLKVSKIRQDYIENARELMSSDNWEKLYKILSYNRTNVCL